MVQSYTEFINENSSSKNLTYSVLTALAIVDPKFFDFLIEPKNRYQMNDQNFWQSFIYELKKHKNIKMSKDHIMDIKGISVENDWNKLKKCVKASEKINNKFSDIEEIKITSDNQLIIKNESDKLNIRNKKPQDKVKQKDLENLLGFDFNDVKKNKTFDVLTQKWISHLENNLKSEYKPWLEYFTDKIENIDYNTFSKFKVKGLGIKIEDMPKLYYSKLTSFCKDIINKREAFRDFDEFLYEWHTIKYELLYAKIILNLLKDTVDRTEEFKDVVIKYHSLDDHSYHRFNNSLELVEMPSKQEFLNSQDINLTYKYKTNANKDLVVDIKNGNLSLKILISTKDIFPSPIKLKSKYVKG